MSQLVVFVVSLLMEPLAAKFADERSESLVNPHVSVERRTTVERFAASLALVRFLRCMYDLVTAQSRCLAEPFSANLADKRSSTCVHWHVSCQVVVRVEDFATFGAWKGFVLGIGIRCCRG